MTLSLKSIFEPANRRVALITCDHVVLYPWADGSLREPLVFDTDNMGQAQFERYLVETPSDPITVVVDLFEEEFRHETIPHVGTKDRNALVERKVARLFRGAAYSYHELQGRETEGRKDDRVLLAAVTNAELVQPWLMLIREQKVPLQAMVSVTQPTRVLLKRLGFSEANMLVASLHAFGGLRQTFYRDGQVKLSRLVRMPTLGTVDFGAQIIREMDKLRRYLNSLRLVDRDNPIEVYILASGATLHELQQKATDSEQVRYHLLDVDELCRGFSLPAPNGPYADALVASQAMESRLPNQYATTDDTVYSRLNQARTAMRAAGIVALLGGFAWGGINALAGISARQQALDAAQIADFYDSQYREARSALPETAVDPTDIESAVELVGELQRRRFTPLTLLGTLGTSLVGFDDVNLQRVKWTSVYADDELESVLGGPLEQNIDAPDPIGWQVAEIEAVLTSFDGDVRRGTARIDELLEVISASPGVIDVSLVTPLMDVSSAASMGAALSDEATGIDAGFALRITTEVTDGG